MAGCGDSTRRELRASGPGQPHRHVRRRAEHRGDAGGRDARLCGFVVDLGSVRVGGSRFANTLPKAVRAQLGERPFTDALGSAAIEGADPTATFEHGGDRRVGSNSGRGDDEEALEIGVARGKGHGGEYTGPSMDQRRTARVLPWSARWRRRVDLRSVVQSVQKS